MYTVQIVSIFRHVNMGEQGLQLSPQILEISLYLVNRTERETDNLFLFPPSPRFERHLSTQKILIFDFIKMSWKLKA